jgi:hypothetical protein
LTAAQPRSWRHTRHSLSWTGRMCASWPPSE